jgi:very-short-patch-repair endonuclease
MRPDRNLDVYAARQYGAFSLEQARRAGMTPKMVETRVATGAWIRFAPSVFVVASSPPRWERQMAAAVLSRPGCLVAGRSAAYLHRMEGFKRSHPTIMVGPTGNARSPIATVIRAKAFPEVERVSLEGFEVSGAADTVITLARDLDRDRLASVIDDGIAARLFTASDLDSALHRWSGWPGLTKLRPLLHERSESAYQPPTNELERLLRRVLNHPSLPAHSRQVPLRFEAAAMTVDAYIPAWRLIVEADGRRWHTRVADFKRDRVRDNEAAANGLAVLRFTYEMLREEPDQCLATLLRTGVSRRAS